MGLLQSTKDVYDSHVLSSTFFKYSQLNYNFYILCKEKIYENTHPRIRAR